jgi:hypothetical protein
MRYLTLPKFNNCKRQHIFHFLEELDSYFQLKGIPAEMKLPKAIKSITDEYTQQWAVTIFKELRNYDHFKRAVTELLLSPQIQTQVRHTKTNSVTVEKRVCMRIFLRYAMMAAKYTPKMSELDISDAIGPIP